MESPANIRNELKQATRSVHDDLDRVSAVLMSGQVPIRNYIDLLSRLLRFHRGFESNLEVKAAQGSEAARFYLRDRRKSPLLEQDLRLLGLPDVEGKDAMPSDLLEDEPRLWAAIYVIEGSTLGGAFIAEKLAKTPYGPATAYYRSYGEHRGSMWNSVVHQLGLLSTDSALVSSMKETALGFFSLFDQIHRQTLATSPLSH